MPRIANWEAVAPKADGERAPMPEPGCYTAAVTEMESVPDKQYVWMVYEMVDPEPDFFKRHGVPKGKHRICLSYRNDQALAMTRGRLKALTDSNPGFDADAAFIGDSWQAFFGKRFGVRMREEESVFTNDQGETVKFVRTSPTEVFPVSAMDEWLKRPLQRKGLSRNDQAKWDAAMDSNPAACRDTTSSEGRGPARSAAAQPPAATPGQIFDAGVPF